MSGNLRVAVGALAVLLAAAVYVAFRLRRDGHALSADSSAAWFVLGRHQLGCHRALVEDSVLLLGAPRSGKGLHVVIPAILESPGAVLTTSTRPDNVAVTLESRARGGPVAVFDPQGLAFGVGEPLRWSLTRGCELPHVAMSRARVLCAAPPDGVENASFWAQQSYTAVRCLLHAAALQGLGPGDLVRWSLSAVAAGEASDILRGHPRAAPAWAPALDGLLSADPRQRDSTWAMVANVFAPLADPAVLAAVSPGPGEGFDPARFIDESGTIFLLGTASGASAAASIVSALIEDVVETAKQLAARSPGARLPSPLALVLDEAANYTLPSLLSLVSEGGGSHISTLVVLQSLAQARARWGVHKAAAVWDSANVKVVLGGGGNAEDLRDLVSLIGTRQEKRVTSSRNGDGSRSTSVTMQDVPVMDTGEIRTMPFGRALLLPRSRPPVRLRMRPWTSRPDAATLRADQSAAERALRHVATP